MVGKAVVKVCFENQEVLKLLVAKGGGLSLLGYDWLSKIQQNWKEIHKVHTKQASLEEILADHSSLFKDELGTIKGTAAKLHINPDAWPLFFHPHSVHYALQTRVDQALEKLQTEWIIEPVEFSEWTEPIVPVIKRDGSIRVCGNYKLMVNQAVEVDVCPLPLVDDLFVSLAGIKYFTKLDLAHVYQQLLLEDDS